MTSKRKFVKTTAVLASLAVAAVAGFVAISPRLDAAASLQDGEFPMPKPGPEHARLASLAGTWDVATKMRMDPAAPWDESKSVETITVACGGFWIIADQKGTMMGAPFEGRMQLGYDTFKKKHVGTWIDNFGSYLTTMEGDYDEKTKTLTMMSDMLDPMSGATMKVKMTTEHVSADETVFQMHFPGPDGKEFVGMEARSKRRK